MSDMRRSGGFTLLEVLVTVIVLTSGVIAVMWALNAGMYAATDAENVDLALAIAQARMEVVKNTPFAGLVDSGPAADPNFSAFSVTVSVAEGQDPMRVDVTAAWNEKGGQSSLALTTLVTNY